MGIVSYAQNFEDVMLWRALGDVSEGFYIDIGAQHPIIDSVSKAFYEQGWRGIHVEPTKEHADLLRTDRPDETVIQAAISNRTGTFRFFEIPGGGLSTARKDIADKHKKNLHCEVVETQVTSMTMDGLLKRVPKGDIHWLKIDVEGFEKEVLAGWQKSPRRPWVIVIEATYPSTRIETYDEWESLVLKKGYNLVYKDGLNRYYLSDKHPQLKDRFSLPPNVFDGFQLGGHASSLTSRIKANHQHEIASITAEKLGIETQLLASQTTFHGLKNEFEEQKSALAEAWKKAEHHLQTLLEHDRIHAERQERIQRESLSREDRLREQQDQKISALTNVWENRGNTLREDYEKRLAETNNLWHRDQSKCEQHYDLLRDELKRTRLDSQKILDVLREELATAVQMAQNDARNYVQVLQERERSHAEHTKNLRLESQGREDKVRKDHESILISLKEEWKSQASQREQEFETQFANAKIRYKKEKDQLKQSNLLLSQEIENTRNETSQALAALKQQSYTAIAAAKAESQLHHRALTENEHAYAEKMAETQRYISARETELNTTHQAQLAAKEDELQSLREGLDLEIAQYLETIEQLSSDNSFLRKSFSWWITKPLRWFNSGADNAPQTTVELSRPRRAVSPIEINSAASTTRQAVIGTPPPLSDLTETNMTLDKLLSLPGEAFIRTAYRTLLGRKVDDAGLHHYLRKIAQGFGKASVIVNLNDSPEAKARKHYQDLLGLPEEAFVDAVYQRLLGRSPDNSGKLHYLDAMKRGVSRKRVIKDIENSQEARIKIGDKALFQKDVDALVHEEKKARSWFGRGNRNQRLEHHTNRVELKLDTLVKDIHHHLHETSLQSQTDALNTNQLQRQIAALLEVSKQRAPENLPAIQDSANSTIITNETSNAASNDSQILNIVKAPTSELHQQISKHVQAWKN